MQSRAQATSPGGLDTPLTVVWAPVVSPLRPTGSDQDQRDDASTCNRAGPVREGSLTGTRRRHGEGDPELARVKSLHVVDFAARASASCRADWSARLWSLIATDTLDNTRCQPAGPRLRADAGAIASTR